MRMFNVWRGRWLVMSVAAMILAATPVCLANETDQFTPPKHGRQLADLGPFINQLVVHRLEQAVTRVNAQIRRAVTDAPSLRTPPKGLGPHARLIPSRRIDPQAVLNVCHSPDGMAKAVWLSFGGAVDLIEGLEKEVHSDQLKKYYAPKLPAYRAADHFRSVYTGLYFILDPRNLFRVSDASTINVYGHDMGTDKVGHFTDMGYHYFKAYREAIRRGDNPDQAMLEAIKLGTTGIASEEGILGYVTAGAYSNADLAANYVGCLFYRNLTQPVTLKGKTRPPMLVREGPYWKLADFVTGDPSFFSRFISDHLDEALNPSKFGILVRDTLRRKVAKRCHDLMTWYKPKYGDHDPHTYFLNLMHVLSTYYGADYGHKGDAHTLVGLWNACGGTQVASSQ